MTTENEESIKADEESTTRSLSELLDASTYQGMTDTEIQTIVDYWRQYAYNEGYTACQTDTSIATQNALVDAANTAYATSQAAFDAAIQTQVSFMTYDGGI